MQVPGLDSTFPTSLWRRVSVYLGGDERSSEFGSSLAAGGSTASNAHWGWSLGAEAGSRIHWKETAESSTWFYDAK